MNSPIWISKYDTGLIKSAYERRKLKRKVIYRMLLNNKKLKTIFEMTAWEANAFLLKADSYSNIDLPPYFEFKNILSSISEKMKGKSHDLFKSGFKPSNFEGVNYLILGSKDGRYSWRPFELIHPVLYVSLVNAITQKDTWLILQKRFEDFQSCKHIRCASIPVDSKRDFKNKGAQIQKWWSEIEQESISLSLDYTYLFHTDISDCYPSIYTHSIPWAIHTKEESKANKKGKELIGNEIDKHLQAMSYGQTNGIPQGSALMDLVAEMVLGAIDLMLEDKITKENISDYHILRYRDDYRIFSNSPVEGHLILKHLSEILSKYGLKLNSSKTFDSQLLVRDSIKIDKLYFLTAQQNFKNLQKHILSIHILAEKYPDSGSIRIALSKLHKKIKKKNLKSEPIIVLISIVVDIMLKSPRSTPVAVAVLGELINALEEYSDKNLMFQKIKRKLERIPNTGLVKIWLQRLSYSIDKNVRYDEALCRLIEGDAVRVWNNDWLDDEYQALVDSSLIVDRKKLEHMESVVAEDEFNIFNY